MEKNICSDHDRNAFKCPFLLNIIACFQNGILDLLKSPSEVVRQYLARFFNALASLSAGKYFKINFLPIWFMYQIFILVWQWLLSLSQFGQQHIFLYCIFVAHIFEKMWPENQSRVSKFIVALENLCHVTTNQFPDRGKCLKTKRLIITLL